SQVWADALSESGDPRGELVALAHAVRVALKGGAFEEALALSGQAAELSRTRRRALLRKPGGFPFREDWRGRELIAFSSDWNHRMRVTSPKKALDRIETFLDELADNRWPRSCNFSGAHHLGVESGAPEEIEPTTDLERACAMVFGPTRCIRR